MIRKLALIVFGLAAAGTATALMAEDPAPPPGKALFETKCHTCHELSAATAQHLSGEEWSAVVHRMIEANGAELSAPEADQIISYLTQAYGPNGSPPNGTVQGGHAALR